MSLLASKICAEIEKSGTISFARFMDLALYFPGLGYYERQPEIGQRGDFYTSVSVGSLFGELLAFQFAEWLDEFKKQNETHQPVKLQLVEAGAHDAKLAADVLRWFKDFRPEIYAIIEYRILEPSLRRREWQKKTLGEFCDKIFWFDDWRAFPRSANSHFAICFSNELFDAFPTHRFGWDAQAKNWFEWGVGWNGAEFVWKRLERPEICFPQLAPELLEVLPDGFVTEICPAATEWWKEAAQSFHAGKLVAIDYGSLNEEFIVPQRSRGTLRAYVQHRLSSDLLANPGEQDITAHVDFSALQKAGEDAGWKTDFLISQASFLTGIAGRAFASSQFSELTAKRAKQFQTLTHPEHLGRSFRVLIQSR